MRTFFLAAALGLASLGFAATPPAQASWLSEFLHRTFDPQPVYPYPVAPYGSYYGRGGHDNQPHWHRSVTPYGQNYWYGRGPHDDLPHQHFRTPYSDGGRSYHPWGYTDSYYPPHPQYYSPW